MNALEGVVHLRYSFIQGTTGPLPAVGGLLSMDRSKTFGNYVCFMFLPLVWAEAGVVPGRSHAGTGGLPTFEAGRAPGTASLTGTLASLKRTRQRKLKLILIYFLEALMCSCLPGSFGL